MENGFPSRCLDNCKHYPRRIIEPPCNTCMWMNEGKDDNYEREEEE